MKLSCIIPCRDVYLRVNLFYSANVDNLQSVETLAEKKWTEKWFVFISDWGEIILV